MASIRHVVAFNGHSKKQVVDVSLPLALTLPGKWLEYRCQKKLLQNLPVFQ
jgi:hypothetical protein